MSEENYNHNNLRTGYIEMDSRLFTEDNMKCAICRNGMTESGYATIVLEKEGTTLVFKNVPAQICDNCGEEYISSEINRTLLTRARAELNKGVTLEMLSFAAFSELSGNPTGLQSML